MKRFALSIVFCVVSATAVFAQEKTPVEGVWRLAEVVVQPNHFRDWVPDVTSAEKEITITSPQPGLIIFTKGYYSQMIVRAQQPRTAVAPPKDSQNLTDIEKIARYEHWRLVIANSGTYEVKGSTLFVRVVVAKSVDSIAKEKPIEVTFKLEGPNTLWLIGKSPTEPRFKLTRVE